MSSAAGATRPVVTIDGPAGPGKSTLGRRLARDLDLPYVNTGLMYRALTARALREGVDLDDGSALARVLGQIGFDLDHDATPPSLRIDGEAPSEDLVAPEVEASVSGASSHPAVRVAMAEEQRRLGAHGAVMEGRDIGSVVFPDAATKLFLEAAPDERVARRTRERETAEGRELVARDRRDARVNPFVPSPGAVVIDTTGLSADEVYRRAIAAVRERTHHG
ncbi:MAG: (d)CMP kinase [Actinomycetota bacterium]